MYCAHIFNIFYIKIKYVFICATHAYIDKYKLIIIFVLYSYNAVNNFFNLSKRKAEKLSAFVTSKWRIFIVH